MNKTMSINELVQTIKQLKEINEQLTPEYAIKSISFVKPTIINNLKEFSGPDRAEVIDAFGYDTTSTEYIRNNDIIFCSGKRTINAAQGSEFKYIDKYIEFDKTFWIDYNYTDMNAQVDVEFHEMFDTIEKIRNSINHSDKYNVNLSLIQTFYLVSDIDDISPVNCF